MPELNETAKAAITDLGRMDGEGWWYTLKLGPAEAFALIIAIQQVHKHPDLPQWTRDSLVDMAHSLERAVGQTGAIQEILREGWQPR